MDSNQVILKNNLTFPTLDTISYNQLIDENSQWGNINSRWASEILIINAVNGSPHVYSGAWYKPLDKYVGVRIFAKQDTIYGYIHLENLIDTDEIVLKDFACKIPKSETSDLLLQFNNPFDEILIIHAQSEASYNFIIYDITGRVILEDELSKSATIYTNLFSQGIYILSLQYNVGIISNSKIIKIRRD